MDGAMIGMITKLKNPKNKVKPIYSGALLRQRLLYIVR